MENSKTIIQKVVAVDRPFALRGHVTSFLCKRKLYDFAFKKLACARLSDSIRSGNVLKAKLRRARLGKGGGNGGKNGFVSLQPPRVFRIERLSTTISEPGTGYQKTISGSYLKQNYSDLVFQTCTIFLK